MTDRAAAARVAFFYTCSVNYNVPDVGRACVEVLERNGVLVAVPEQKCCGMPFLDCGDMDGMRANLRYNVARLLPLVRQGYDIVTPGPSCSLMLKLEYPGFVPSDETREVAAATYDICEYLVKRKAQGKLATDFVRPLGTIAYHHACHLRAQRMGPKAVQLLRLVPGTTVQMVEACSGHDGTWGMKTEFFQLSLKQGDRLFRGMTKPDADYAASDCPLAAQQIRQGTDLEAVHPILLLHHAYGLGPGLAARRRAPDAASRGPTMQKLTLADITPPDRYEPRRAAFRAMIMEHKRPRRASVGDRVTFVFEDRQTVRFQIQEMCRIERITEPAKIAEEVAVYNDLVPAAGELVATMFIEVADQAQIAPVLNELVGLRDAVRLEAGGERIPAESIPGHGAGDRLAAVEYIRFRLTPAAVAALRSGAEAALVTAHPRYTHRMVLPAATRHALLEDLSDAPAAA